MSGFDNLDALLRFKAGLEALCVAEGVALFFDETKPASVFLGDDLVAQLRESHGDNETHDGDGTIFDLLVTCRYCDGHRRVGFNKLCPRCKGTGQQELTA